MADNNITFVPIQQLILDEENPRLPESVPRTQSGMLNYIARNTAIEDLMSAIGANGYFEGEPVIVYRNKTDPKNLLRVVEGNRRLTAVKLLNNPALCKSRKTIADIAAEAEYVPDSIPVIVRTTREEVLPYLGSRHIVGVQQWEPLAKARYMYQLFQEMTDSDASPSERYRQVAKRIGSHTRSDYIKKNLDALAVFEVVKKNGFYGIDELSEDTIDFGTLYSALPYKGIANFVGSGILQGEDEDETFNPSHPIVKPSALKKGNVELLTRWLFETLDDGKTLLQESRNIPRLDAICRSQTAIAALKKGASFSVAYVISAGVDGEFEEHLQKARNYLAEASAIMGDLRKPRSVLALAESVQSMAQTIRLAVKAKIEQ
jgi:hypothetical protein